MKILVAACAALMALSVATAQGTKPTAPKPMPAEALPDGLNSLKFMLGDWKAKGTMNTPDGAKLDWWGTIKFSLTLKGSHMMAAYSITVAPEDKTEEGLMLICVNDKGDAYKAIGFSSDSVAHEDMAGKLSMGKLVLEGTNPESKATTRLTFAPKPGGGVLLTVEEKSGDKWKTFIEGTFVK
jgi:hypothetical protein